MKHTKRNLGLAGLTAVMAVSMMGAASAADVKETTVSQMHSVTISADGDAAGTQLLNADAKNMTFQIVMTESGAADGSFLVIRLDETTGKMVCSSDGGKTWTPYAVDAAALGTYDGIIEVSPSKAAQTK